MLDPIAACADRASDRQLAPRTAATAAERFAPCLAHPMLRWARMNKSSRKRLQLRPLTVRILELDPGYLAAGVKATIQDACSGTCSCTDPGTLCKPCHA